MGKVKLCSILDCHGIHYGLGFCRNHYCVEWRRNNPNSVKASIKRHDKSGKRLIAQKKYMETIRYKWNQLRKVARNRGININISFEEYENIRKRKCYYCGGILPHFGGGLDRIDNKKGYEKNNILPCCTNCNLLKRDLVSSNEMKQIVNLLKKVRNTKDIWIDKA